MRTGYQGRAPLIEWLRLNEATRASLREHDLAAVRPHHTFEDEVRRLIAEGVTNEAEQRRLLGT